MTAGECEGAMTNVLTCKAGQGASKRSSRVSELSSLLPAPAFTGLSGCCCCCCCGVWLAGGALLGFQGHFQEKAGCL